MRKSCSDGIFRAVLTWFVVALLLGAAGGGLAQKARAGDGDASGVTPVNAKKRQNWCGAFLAPDRVGNFGGRVALTFDDGPDSSLTPGIIRTLRRHGAPATFFMLGQRVRTYRPARGYDIATLAAAPDITIANHSYGHPRLTGRPGPKLHSQIDRTNAALTAAGAHPTLFRFPFGVKPCGAEADLRARGYTEVGWHVDSADWCYASGGRCSPGTYNLFRWVPEAMRRNMTKFILYQLRSTNGGIVLFHDIHRSTANSLDAVLSAITAAGYTYTSLDDVATFPRLNGSTSAPGRRIVKVGAACRTNADCDLGLPSFLGFCHPDGYCSMACENSCRGRGTTCRADPRVSADYKVCVRRD